VGGPSVRPYLTANLYHNVISDTMTNPRMNVNAPPSADRSPVDSGLPAHRRQTAIREKRHALCAGFMPVSAAWSGTLGSWITRLSTGSEHAGMIRWKLYHPTPSRTIAIGRHAEENSGFPAWVTGRHVTPVTLLAIVYRRADSAQSTPKLACLLFP
jgi:hypothetical protein